MKQFILLKDVALPRYKTGTTPYTHEDDLTALADGSIAVFDQSTGTLLSHPAAAGPARINSDFIITKGAAFGKPLTDIFANRNFIATKSTYSAGANKVATLTMPTPVVGEEYTVILSKKGKQFNERSNWTAVAIGKSGIDADEDLASDLQEALAKLVDGHNVTVTASAEVITFTGNDFEDFEVTFDFDATYAVTTAFAMPQNDVNAIKELFRQCIGSKGYEYTEGDKYEIYPGYLKDIAQIEANTGYTVYTLRFANDSKTKTTNNDVNQVVHIVVVEKTTNASTAATYYSAIVGSLNLIFGC